MPGSVSFALHFWDYFAFFAFFLVLSAIGYWAGRKERAGATEYFLAGKRLPWYVVVGSFIASNISTEHFIGMIGVAGERGSGRLRSSRKRRHLQHLLPSDQLVFAEVDLACVEGLIR